MRITSRYNFLVAPLLLASLPIDLAAHRQWMLPSATVISNPNGWVTVDAAVSNELFYFDHVPMRLTALNITAPDGTKVEAENAATGKYRSTFDVHLTQAGTYKIAQVNQTAMATWTEKGSAKNWRGPVANLQKEVPADAEGLKTSKMSSRIEIFVTSGKPSTKALEITGSGLELKTITHPNDLAAGETAKFQFLNDGKPAANLEVTVIPGGIRYRDQLKEVKIKTDADGNFSVPFKEPGMYWMNASTGAGRRGPGGPGGPGGAPGGPGGAAAKGGGAPRGPMGDSASYVAVLEVLPQ